MNAIKSQLVGGDWLATDYITANGKKITVIVPPKIGGTSEDPKKDWDITASNRMAQKIANQQIQPTKQSGG